MEDNIQGKVPIFKLVKSSSIHFTELKFRDVNCFKAGDMYSYCIELVYRIDELLTPFLEYNEGKL